MDKSEKSARPPVDAKDVLDGYFIENRAKILDLAAFMDRFDRANPPNSATADHRWQAVIRALNILTDGSKERSRRILELWSDPTADPVPKADVKGATGAWPGLSGTVKSRSS